MASDPAWCETHRRRECQAQRSKGRGDCHASAIAGSKPARCRMHIGGAKSKAKAAINDAVSRWTDGMSTLDPGETLLRLMTVAYLRAEQHADELDVILTRHGWHDTFVGDTLVTTENGDTVKVGEYARRLAEWETLERRQAAELAVKAVTAGLEERRVRAEEAQVALFAQALDATLADLDLADRSAEVKHGVARHLRLAAS